MNRQFLRYAWCLLIFAATCAGCKRGASATPPSAPEVTVQRPVQQMVTDRVDLTGTVSALTTVDLVARVQGYLREAPFTDGTFVKEGDLLFLIEPDSYQQQLKLQEAALVKAEAEYKRQEAMIRDNATSVANVDKARSDRDQAQANVELAKLNLGYTQVKAPFAGRIGRRLVDPGNLVGPSVNTKLATLDQLVPIHVYFNLNERDALRIRETMRQKGITTRPAKVPVFVGLQTEEGYPHEGNLDFVSTGVSTGQGTVELRAVLPNEDLALIPGAFVRVRIPLGEGRPMLVIPGSALANDQEGDYVLVVAGDGKVARRSVEKGPLVAGGCAIRSGLSGEDQVIVEGGVNARNGLRVKVVFREPTSAPAGKAEN